MMSHFQIFEPFAADLVHAIFDRSIDARTRRETIAQYLGIPLERLISASQTHGKNVFVFRAGDPLPTSEVDDVDAFVSNAPGVFFMIKVADCQAILFYDPVARVISAVHSGWRGSVQNIASETVSVMQKQFGCRPWDIRVGISPSLGPCCQIFTDPFHELPLAFHRYIQDNGAVNFWQATLDQLRAAGVLPQHIEHSHICNSCHTDEYFSYRKEGSATGRFCAVIGIH